MLCGAAALASCNLDTIPTDKYTVETFWETEEGTEAAMTGCYNILTNSALFGDSAPLLEETCTPNAYNYNNAGGYNVIAQGTHTANSSGIIATAGKSATRASDAATPISTACLPPSWPTTAGCRWRARPSSSARSITTCW